MQTTRISILLAAAASVSAAFITASPALVRRPQLAPLSGPVCCAESGATNDPVPKPPSKLPQREIDSRGFIVPQVGDVVKMPSKWKGEWEVGQVDFVQYVGSRNAYEVDLLPLKSIGNDLYRLPGKKPSLIRTDVAKLGRLLTEYVPERDAYRVNPDDLLPTGGRKVENPSVTEQGLAEYAELKATLLREAALLGVAGTAVSLPFFGGDVAFAFALGAAGGCAYLALLQRETDGREGMGRLLAAIVGGRLALPAVVMAVLASRGIAAKGGQFDFALVRAAHARALPTVHHQRASSRASSATTAAGTNGLRCRHLGSTSLGRALPHRRFPTGASTQALPRALPLTNTRALALTGRYLATSSGQRCSASSRTRRRCSCARSAPLSRSSRLTRGHRRPLRSL
jgi:hypothetical protein